MAFCGRGSGPIMPICYTNRLTVPRDMCTKFHKDISIFTQVTACTDGRTDSHPDFNSFLHPDHLYIHNPISNSISFRWYKKPLGQQNYYILYKLRDYTNYEFWRLFSAMNFTISELMGSRTASKPAVSSGEVEYFECFFAFGIYQWLHDSIVSKRSKNSFELHLPASNDLTAALVVRKEQIWCSSHLQLCHESCLMHFFLRYLLS